MGIPYFKAGTEALHGVAWSNDIDNGWQQVFATAQRSSRRRLVWRAPGTLTWSSASGLRSATKPAPTTRINPRLWGLQPVGAGGRTSLRDPRWGRNEEGYSEDPQLTGDIATAYGRGLSGDDPKYLKTAPTLKHSAPTTTRPTATCTSSNVPPRVTQ